MSFLFNLLLFSLNLLVYCLLKTSSASYKLNNSELDLWCSSNLLFPLPIVPLVTPLAQAVQIELMLVWAVLDLNSDFLRVKQPR